MCLCPKKILYRGNHWFPNGQPLFLTVPCGHCEECNRQLQNDWFVRCYYEWKTRPVGCTFFYTLTYNPDFLPMYEGVPVFKRRDIQLFIKRLKKALKFFGIDLRYIITSEFGELYGRPHFHALFFLSKSINPYVFYKIVRDCWSMYDKYSGLSVSRGFVQYGDNCGVVDSASGIKYVTKYVIKDFSHTDKFEIDLAHKLFERYSKLLEYCQEKWSLFKGLHFDFDSSTLQMKQFVFKAGKKHYLPYQPTEKISVFIRKYRSKRSTMNPFHTQSTKLGVSILESNTDFSRKKIGVMTEKGFQELPLPRYIERCLWYDVLPNEKDGKRTRFVLNEKGKQQIIEKLPSDFDTYKRNVGSLRGLSFADSRSQINKFVLDKVNEACGRIMFQDVSILCHWLCHFDLDLDVLAIYNKVFRGRVCPVKFKDIPFNDISIKNNWVDYCMYFLNAVSVTDYGKIYERPIELIQQFESQLFNYHPYFQIYESSSVIIDAVTTALAELSLNERVYKDRLRSSLRQVVKKKQTDLTHF